MKWSNHIEIADKALEGLLSIEDRAKLCRYNLETDECYTFGWRGHYVSHHKRSDREVIDLIDSARVKLYLDDQDGFIQRSLLILLINS